MSYRARLSTTILTSLVLFSGAILIWAYQTGKVTILGSQATSLISKKYDTFEELTQSGYQADEGLDLQTEEGKIKLKSDCPESFFIGTHGFTTESNKEWIDKFKISYVRGHQEYVLKRDINELQDLISRYGGTLKVAPTISRWLEGLPAERVKLMKEEAASWSKKSKKDDKTFQVLDVNIDDWNGWYRYPIGWNLSTKSFDLNLATQNMLSIIEATKSSNPNLLFGVVVYDIKMGDPKNLFYFSQLENRSSCEKCVDSTDEADFDCVKCSSCCALLKEIIVSDEVLDKIDVVHLYFRRRANSENIAKYVELAKKKFPNAKVVVGIYMWGNFSIRYDKRIFPDPLTKAGEKRIFEKSVKDACSLLKEKKIEGLEFYTGKFGEEDKYKEELTSEEIQSAKEDRETAYRILKEYLFKCYSTGKKVSYISPEIKVEDLDGELISFEPFEVKPKGTSISYQYSQQVGDTWSDWTVLPSPSSAIPLSGLIEDVPLVRIKMSLVTSDPEKTPVLDGFSVSYQVAGVEPGQEPSVSDAYSEAGIEGVGTLVSTGIVLWFNILVALVLSGAIAYLIFRKRPST